MTVTEIKEERNNIALKLRGLEKTMKKQKDDLAAIFKEAEEKSRDIKETDRKISELYTAYEKLGQKWLDIT